MAEKESYLHRVFALLDCFTAEHPELGVREASRMLGISRSATGRLMSELRNEGVLTQDLDTSLYSLGGRVIRWAGVYEAASDLSVKALPYIRQLLNKTNETVSLYVVEGNERVCIERLESRQNVRIVEPIGQRLKLYAGSGGRAILAFMPPEEINRILKLAEQEITEGDVQEQIREIREHLEEVRKTGVAISHGQWVDGASGIAAPIFDESGLPIGSVSVSGPTNRFRDQKTLDAYRELLLSTMEKLSNEMGYRSDRIIANP